MTNQTASSVDLKNVKLGDIIHKAMRDHLAEFSYGFGDHEITLLDMPVASIANLLPRAFRVVGSNETDSKALALLRKDRGDKDAKFSDLSDDEKDAYREPIWEAAFAAIVNGEIGAGRAPGEGGATLKMRAAQAVLDGLGVDWKPYMPNPNATGKRGSRAEIVDEDAKERILRGFIAGAEGKDGDTASAPYKIGRKFAEKFSAKVAELRDAAANAKPRERVSLADLAAE